jgi:hypothetical protein
MGAPNPQVVYISATTGRGTTKSIRDMWWDWEKGVLFRTQFFSSLIFDGQTSVIVPLQTPLKTVDLFFFRQCPHFGVAW